MRLQELKAQLQRLGTAQNCKVYQRHGYGAGTYGVSFANLAKLKKAIKTDHALALQLWKGGNVDERSLALMIADPSLATLSELEAWAAELDGYLLSDLFASYVGKTSYAKDLAPRFSKSKIDWVSRAGWGIYAALALNDALLTDPFFLALLKRIEAQIHRASNYTRHAMNNTLIAIGIRNPVLQRAALAAAGRIGQVVVDHGQTSCKTPDAATYIERTIAHRARREAKKKASGKPLPNTKKLPSTKGASTRRSATEKKPKATSARKLPVPRNSARMKATATRRS